MSRRLAVLLAFTLLLAGGTLHGMLTERWSPSLALEEAIVRLDKVPFEVGDWVGQESEQAIDRDAMNQAGARGYTVRVYTHQRTKVKILMILMCGRPGKMSVHTPEVCYQGAGYEMRGEPARFRVPNAPSDSYWLARFAKPTGLTSDLRLYWSWATNHAFEASDKPRWRYRGEPYLYKLYISCDQNPVAENDSGMSADFLRVLTPELHHALFSASNVKVN